MGKNKPLKFHIDSNDYFGTLATILSLVRQTIGNKKSIDNNIKTLDNIEKDLMYLQQNYKIGQHNVLAFCHIFKF